MDPSWNDTEMANATVFNQNLPVDEEINTANLLGEQSDDDKFKK